MNNPATTSEWIGRRRLRASVDRTLGVKVPKAVFDEAEAYARRKMAFQNEALGLDRGDEYLELLIPDVIREMALAARYDGRRRRLRLPLLLCRPCTDRSRNPAQVSGVRTTHRKEAKP